MKKAFSLIELIIVVVIMGVIYTLIIPNLKNFKEKNIQVSLDNLKDYLQKIPHEKNVKLFCVDNCQNCKVVVDDNYDDSSIIINDFIDSSVEVYRYDFFLGLQSLDKKIYFNKDNIEEDICFSLSVDKLGVSDQVIVAYQNKYYDFTNYLGKTKVYDSSKELMNDKNNINQGILK